MYAKRDWFFWDGGDGSSGWYTWGRWVLLGVIIGVALLAFLFLEVMSCRRARQGRQPISGTAWMVPPSYYRTYQQDQEDSVPVYKQNVGEGDAGHYDADGTFVPLQTPYPVAQGPPPGPPPSHTESMQDSKYPPPPGPPPAAATGASSSAYYPPNR